MTLWGIQTSSQWLERSVCASVSKRQLITLSNIHRNEVAESNSIKGEGSLIRSIFGMKP